MAVKTSTGWIKVDNSDENKVKYDINDTSAGYVADKFVAGTGITLEEGTGTDENKLKIVNSLDLSAYAKLDTTNQPFTGGSVASVTINSTPDSQGGIDASTQLMLHMDGANGGTTFVDSSQWGKAVTPTNMVTSTDNVKLGTAAAYGTGQLSLPTFDVYSPRDYDYTWDFWFYHAADSTIFSMTETADKRFLLYTTGGAIQFIYQYVYPKAFYATSAAGSIPLNQWSHIAIVRTVAGTLKMYVNGQSVAVTKNWGSYSNTMSYINAPLLVRCTGTGNYLDEVRFSTIARWTSDFVPPTRPYDSTPPVSTPGLILTGSGARTAKIYTDGNASDSIKIDDATGTRVTIAQTTGDTTFTGKVSAASLTATDLTASQITATDANKKLQSLAVATYPSLTELSYVKGLTSALQTQLDARLKLNQTTPQVITATDVTVTASDEIYYGDVSDGTKIKKDTVQGILDLVNLTPYATQEYAYFRSN